MSWTSVTRRRGAALVVTMACSTLTVAGCSGTAPAPSATAQATPSSATGVLFGGDDDLLQHQSSLGRKLAIVRTYHLLSVDNFPTRDEVQAMDQGATLLTSFRAGDWSTVTSGANDADIRNLLRKANQAAIDHHLGSLYITFNHEADTNAFKQGPGGQQHDHNGSPADFVNAWNHIHDLAQNMGVNWQQGGRLHWVLILTPAPYNNGSAIKFWPGTSSVDAYNTADCQKTAPDRTYLATGQPASPDQIFGPTLAFAARTAPGLPVFIPEWGSIPYQDPHTRADFITTMTTYVTAHPQIRAALWWDKHGQNNACDYTLTDDPAATRALAEMGSNPHFQATN